MFEGPGPQNAIMVGFLKVLCVFRGWCVGLVSSPSSLSRGGRNPSSTKRVTILDDSGLIKNVWGSFSSGVGRERFVGVLAWIVLYVWRGIDARQKAWP